MHWVPTALEHKSLATFWTYICILSLRMFSNHSELSHSFSSLPTSCTYSIFPIAIAEVMDFSLFPFPFSRMLPIFTACWFCCSLLKPYPRVMDNCKEIVFSKLSKAVAYMNSAAETACTRLVQAQARYSSGIERWRGHEVLTYGCWERGNLFASRIRPWWVDHAP